jgi:hypothetical protein
MNHSSSTEQAKQAYIVACNHCHQICLQTAMNYRLETGGKYLEAKHFRLIMNCADICQTSANFQLSSSDFHHRLCKICTEVCEACSANCEKIGGMDEYAEVCRECAVSCWQMVGVLH